MQFLPYLLAFVAGGLFTIAADVAAGKFPKPSRVRAEDPCRNCDAIECGDESWPRPICCDGCTHGR